MRRATLRAASWTLRTILRIEVFGQHLAFIGHVAQSVCLDRKMMVLALVTCERSFLKARHSLRNTLPAGQALITHVLQAVVPTNKFRISRPHGSSRSD
jgi:hypothetical protein